MYRFINEFSYAFIQFMLFLCLVFFVLVIIGIDVCICEVVLFGTRSGD